VSEYTSLFRTLPGRSRSPESTEGKTSDSEESENFKKKNEEKIKLIAQSDVAPNEESTIWKPYYFGIRSRLHQRDSESYKNFFADRRQSDPEKHGNSQYPPPAAHSENLTTEDIKRPRRSSSVGTDLFSKDKSLTSISNPGLEIPIYRKGKGKFKEKEPERKREGTIRSPLGKIRKKPRSISTIDYAKLENSANKLTVNNEVFNMDLLKTAPVDAKNMEKRKIQNFPKIEKDTRGFENYPRSQEGYLKKMFVIKKDFTVEVS